MRYTMALALALALAGCSDDSGTVIPDTAVVDSAVMDLPQVDGTSRSDSGASDLPPSDGTSASDNGASDLPQADGTSTSDSGASDLPGTPDLSPASDAADPCDAAKQAVLDEMARINHCTVASDCAFIYGACPFGCYIPHGAAESTQSLSQLMAAFTAMTQCPQCVYKCASPGTLACTNGSCEMTFP